jgi:lysophospholipase L1-like esterase
MPGLQTNAEGFRDPQDWSSKLRGLKGRYVVAVVGSSGGFGVGIAANEDTFGPVIERELARRGLRTATFNLSVSLYSTRQERLLLEDWAPRLRPDLVVALAGYNDMGGMGISDETRLGMSEPLRLILLPYQDKRHLGRALELLGHRWVPRVSAAQYVEDLRGMARALQDNGGGSLLVLPMFEPRAEFAAQPEIRAYNRTAAAAFAGGGAIRYLGRTDGEDPELEAPGYFLNGGIHPSAKGVTAVVRWMLPAMESALRARRPNHG